MRAGSKANTEAEDEEGAEAVALSWLVSSSEMDELDSAGDESSDADDEDDEQEGECAAVKRLPS